MPYGSEIVIYGGVGFEYGLFADDDGSGNKVIYGETAFTLENVGGARCFVKMSDVEIMSERSYFTLVPYFPQVYVKAPLFYATTTYEKSFYSDQDLLNPYTFQIPAGTALSIYDIKPSQKYSPSGKTRYNNIDGFIACGSSTGGINFTVRLRVINPNGAPYYFDSLLINRENLPYGSQIETTSDEGFSQDGGIIYVRLPDAITDVEGNTFTAYLNLSDLEFII